LADQRELFVVAYFPHVLFFPFPFSSSRLCLSAGSRGMENQNGIRILRLAHEFITPYRCLLVTMYLMDISPEYVAVVDSTNGKIRAQIIGF
jgi:hypothetical protein